MTQVYLENYVTKIIHKFKKNIHTHHRDLLCIMIYQSQSPTRWLTQLAGDVELIPLYGHLVYQHQTSQNYKLYKTHHYVLQLATNLTPTFNICIKKQTCTHKSDKNHNIPHIHSILLQSIQHPDKRKRVKDEGSLVHFIQVSNK